MATLAALRIDLYRQIRSSEQRITDSCRNLAFFLFHRNGPGSMENDKMIKIGIKQRLQANWDNLRRAANKRSNVKSSAMYQKVNEISC